MSANDLWGRSVGRSIRAKLMLATVLSSVLAVSLVLAAVSYLDSARAREEQRAEMERLSGFAIHHLTLPLALGGVYAEDAVRTLAELEAFPDVMRAWVIDGDGELFARWDRNGDADSELPTRDEDGIHQSGDRILMRSSFDTDVGNGILYVEADRGAQARLRALYLKLALVALLVATLSVTLALWPLRVWVARPIADLAHAARQVSSSRESRIALPAASEDEVGVLVTAFEDMLREIRRHEGELRRAMEMAERSASEASRQANEIELTNIQLRAEMAERKRLEEQLLQSQKMESIGQLAGGIAHDFNNLLTVILGWTEYAGSEPLEVERMSEGLEQIRQSADRAASLTRQLLAFARRQVARPRRTDLNRLIEELARMLRRVLGERIELRLDLSAGLAEVFVDPGQFEQVLLNMALNSKDAMPNGGLLKIRTSSTLGADGKEWVCLEIADNGAGIAEEIRAKIFEPFFTTKAQGQGTGLGLSMCYGIVRQCGGSIDVHSTPGRGATFRILIPPAPEDAGDADAGIPSEGRVRGNELVLIAEDERAVRQLLESTLRTNGYRVLSAADGWAALALAREHDFAIDIVVSDLVMPNMGGRELIRELRAINPQLPAVFVSGYDASLVDEAMPKLPPLTELVEKPFAPSELMNAIRAALRRAAQS